MPPSLKNAEFEIACPNCSKSIKVRFEDIGSSVTCQHCKQEIHLQGNDFSKNARKVEQAISRLAKNLKHR